MESPGQEADTDLAVFNNHDQPLARQFPVGNERFLKIGCSKLQTILSTRTAGWVRRGEGDHECPF